MFIMDGHCDTLTKIMETKEELYQNCCHVDLQRMKKYDGWVQLFAAFIEPSFGQAYSLKRAIQIIDTMYLELERNKDKVSLCLCYEDIQKAIKENKIAAMISVEGGDALQGELSTLRMLYKLGVRSICLTWNHRNEIGDGVADDVTGGGLTHFGRSVVTEMNSLGMLVDVSHLSEGGFWDVLDVTSKPIIASHSNAKKICYHRRNLHDEQIIALSKNGGLMGINFYPPFLTKEKEASLLDITKHIEHIAGLVGCLHIGIGADFDGIETTPTDVRGVQDIDKLINILLKMNYSQEDVENIMGLNFLRVIQKTIQ